MIEHPQILFSAVLLSVAAFVACLFWMLPDWSRPGIFFAVTIVPEFRNSPEARRVLRSYRLQTLLHTGIGFAVMLEGALQQHFVFLIAGALWLAVGPLIAIAKAHAKTLPHAVAVSTVREAPLSPRRTQLPGGWILQLGPFGILLVTAGYLRMHWDEIPARFPVHWGIDGMPNGWALRTPAGVYGPLVLGAFVVAGISLLAYGISHMARRVIPTGWAAGSMDPAQRIALILMAIEFFIAAISSLVALLPFTGNPGVVPIVILALVILLSAILLRGWLRRAPASLEETAGDGMPDACWKLGLFYYNPDDSALFVEKRVGIGYTVNFGHASAWIITALILLLPLSLAALAILNR
ncbi:MAG TPA: DUF5808 domain-containing protein [Candidatus Acidoferrales bacterium]|nr:DUF5808 domain-containing protein [Candidatus Acidoferrales bacterium]